MNAPERLLAWTLALGAFQLACSLLFLLRQRRRPPVPRAWPAVSVLVPCGGSLPDLEGAAAALLAQEYPGRWEVVFAASSSGARAALERACAGSEGRARVVAARSGPERSSDKAVHLLAALAAASADSEVLAFADADQRVAAGWLAGLAAELAGGARVATSVALPERGLELCWTLFGLPYLDLFGVVCGQSFALRRGDFDSLQAARLWERTVSEDLSLSRAARAAGLEVRIAMRLAPSSSRRRGAVELVGALNRWMMLFRVYHKPLWLMALAAVGAKACFLAEALFLHRAAHWETVLALLGAEALNLALLASGLGLSPALALGAPALLALHATNALASLGPRRVRWGGYLYRLRGPLDVSAEAR